MPRAQRSPMYPTYAARVCPVSIPVCAARSICPTHCSAASRVGWLFLRLTRCLVSGSTQRTRAQTRTPRGPARSPMSTVSFAPNGAWLPQLPCRHRATARAAQNPKERNMWITERTILLGADLRRSALRGHDQRMRHGGASRPRRHDQAGSGHHPPLHRCQKSGRTCAPSSPPPRPCRLMVGLRLSHCHD
jgi:hypothetical protein